MDLDCTIFILTIILDVHYVMKLSSFGKHEEQEHIKHTYKTQGII